MEVIGKHEIESLLRVQEGPAVSIFQPVSRIGDQQDAIRYKNLLARAEEKLIEQGVRSAEARLLLEPEYTYVENPDYWMHLGADGLAVFRSKETSLRYQLPLSLQELVIVGQRFHIKPLLPMLDHERYLVLALSKKKLRLFDGNRYRLTEMKLPEDTPQSLAEALKYDDPERQLQYHTKTGSPSGGQRRAMFHGQGVGIDEEKENLERYFQAVDRSLFPLLEDSEFPVILAGTEELHSVYQRVTRSKTILPGGISGNVKDLTGEDFHRKAWAIAREYFAEGRREAERTYHENLTRGRAVNDLASVLEAAYNGRVDTLFVAENEQVWGIYHLVKHEVVLLDEQDPAAVDLLDQAVAWTFEKNGKIYVQKKEDMPEQNQICALLRYTY